ncbi:uncharacterized protein LOC116657314 [Camelus ferus]|uniref:Uncharacterized protein LOC116657314 n=1 Tax=Camelus ferus TaxID=419612 RepID=A0A8B8RBH3_CAMFR|nr:uncharacterized protein LOC116657314 [Camelus ferus]
MSAWLADTRAARSGPSKQQCRRPCTSFVLELLRTLSLSQASLLKPSAVRAGLIAEATTHRTAGEVSLPYCRSGLSGQETGWRLNTQRVPRPQRPSPQRLPRRGPSGGAAAHWSAVSLRPPRHRPYWPEPRRPQDRRWRRPAPAPALKRTTRKRPPPCVPPLGLVCWLAAPPCSSRPSPGSLRLRLRRGGGGQQSMRLCCFLVSVINPCDILQKWIIERGNWSAKNQKVHFQCCEIQIKRGWS